MFQAFFAIAVVFGIFAGWVGVMHWARKWDRLPSDCDMLGDTGKGCAHCASRNVCDVAEASEARPGKRD